MVSPVNSVHHDDKATTTQADEYAAKEEALARRYNRAKQPDLVFEFTRDPGLLHQYYKIRANEFIDVLGLTSGYPENETEHDRNGQILVARIGNFCVGGVRLVSKTPRNPRLLPMEIDDFRLENYFPDLRHKQISYGQLSNLSLLPEFRNREISREMMKRLFSKADAMNLSMLFAASPKLNSRLYRQNCILMGFQNTKIYWDIELPVYQYLEEIKLYLMSSVIDKSVKTNSSRLVSTARSHSFEKEINSNFDEIIFNNSTVHLYNEHMIGA